MGSPTFKTWKRMIRDGQPNELSDERIVKLVESGAWDLVADHENYAELAMFLRNAFKHKRVILPSDPLRFVLVVNYDESVETLVKRGKYDWANDDITSKNFPTTRTGTAEVELHLVHLNRLVSTEEALRELDQMGFRSAELKELLVPGAEMPNLQKRFPVVALGSVWRAPGGDRCCACLDWDAVRRGLNLRWFESSWDEDFRFAAVRK